MPAPELSVAICTHSPDMRVFSRVLAALESQTLAKDRWELLIVDNASPEPVAGTLGNTLAGWPAARVVIEPKPGIGSARRRALAEARAPLVCFLDDDTIPALDFLERGLAKAAEWPELGCWGGQLRPEWGAPPPPWLGPYQCLLGVREVARDLWSNERYAFAALPPTAGMFLRAEVGAEWIRQVTADPRRTWLGSHGRDLRRGEDTDLAFCAHDLGLGTAVFTDLVITHVIPPERLSLEAVAAQVQASRTSMYVLFALRGRDSFPRPKPRLVRLAEAFARWRLPRPQRQLAAAELAAVAEARAVISALGQPPEASP